MTTVTLSAEDWTLVLGSLEMAALRVTQYGALAPSLTGGIDAKPHADNLRRIKSDIKAQLEA